MPVDAIIQHGNLPADGTLLDEANLLVQSLTVTAAREKKAYRGPNRATNALQYTDPTLTFAFKAYVSEAAVLATQHPGTQVNELANYAAARRGFDPAEGMMIYEDPSDEFTTEDADMVSFNVVQYPFVEPAA
jgi:hypothetical protein